MRVRTCRAAAPPSFPIPARLISTVSVCLVTYVIQLQPYQISMLPAIKLVAGAGSTIAGIVLSKKGNDVSASALTRSEIIHKDAIETAISHHVRDFYQARVFQRQSLYQDRILAERNLKLQREWVSLSVCF